MGRAAEPSIYIVDDDDAVRESLAVLLEACGFSVCSYASGKAFLDALDPGMSACVLIDIDMPGMGGLDLLKALGKRAAHLPAIMITGRGDAVLERSVKAAGASALLYKPVDDEVLLAAIAEATAGTA